jgi:hypothetical protein
MYQFKRFSGGKNMKKRLLLITRLTLIALAALALIPIREQLVPPAAASTKSNQHKNSLSIAGTTHGSSPAEYADGRQMIGAHSLASLTAQFWRWNYSIPVGVDPGSDTTGVNCGINQEGDVWFLAGPASGDSTASCTVPNDKTIVAAVYTSIDDYPCPDSTFQPPPGQSLEDFLTQDDQQFVDGEITAAYLDGRPLKSMRIKSGLFKFTAAANHVVSDPCVTGSPQLAVSDGFFVFVEPLHPGDHVLVLNWSGPFATGTRTVNLKIR